MAFNNRFIPIGSELLNTCVRHSELGEKHEVSRATLQTCVDCRLRRDFNIQSRKMARFLYGLVRDARVKPDGITPFYEHLTDSENVPRPLLWFHDVIGDQLRERHEDALKRFGNDDDEYSARRNEERRDALNLLDKQRNLETMFRHNYDKAELLKENGCDDELLKSSVIGINKTQYVIQDMGEYALYDMLDPKGALNFTGYSDPESVLAKKHLVVTLRDPKPDTNDNMDEQQPSTSGYKPNNADGEPAPTFENMTDHCSIS